jgi:hypothetical protein
MRVVAGCLLLVSGCGRFGFGAQPDAEPADGSRADARPDALGGHDEDGDGVADSIDVCPHIPDVLQQDGDGDGVGDRCDPDPFVPAQSWLVFSALTAGDLPLIVAGPAGSWTMDSDSWHFTNPGSAGQLIRTQATNDVDIWAGFDVTGFVAGSGKQLSIVINGSGQYYYGELFDNRLGITHYDGTSFTPVSGQVSDALATPGRIDLHLTARSTPSPMFTITAERGGVAMTSSAPAPGYIGNGFELLGVDKLVVDVRYFAMVMTTP